MELCHVTLRGVVQGVGFRPFVYQLAAKHGLTGWVLNTSEAVELEVEGSRKEIDGFLRELETGAPPLARIEHVVSRFASPRGYSGFEIRDSISQQGRYQPVSPDIATCPACLSEIFDPHDRRYRYPFTNCTNCGPRFTIIKDIPYDRALTTMSAFDMCPACSREYHDPMDRRFHAQPNACPVCGPRLQLLDNRGGQFPCTDEIAAAAALLREGKVVAIKGLGGFLLACDATSQAAVEELRRRKRRPFKPLAIMVRDLGEAREHCELSPDEERLLISPSSPIVLLRWKPSSKAARSVAPGLTHLGVMLPYTPLHHLVMHDAGLPLVMTSGNLSEEPIAGDNDEALRRLSGIADYFLVHNRDIYARYDDSVSVLEGGVPRLVRRARGYAPYPIRLSFKAGQVLGCGAEERNTFCLTRDDRAFLSQHIGDMENLETLQHFENTVALYRHLFRVQPETVACDLHPDYLATRYARELADREGLKLVGVQHHHAHIASCLADNGLDAPAIGVAFDGTGYGSDGHIWGGEFLLADYRDFQRLAHLEYLPLPGGAAAVKRPYRIALGYLYRLLGDDAVRWFASLRGVDPVEAALIERQIDRGLNSPLNSSMGRLFDAVSALAGVRMEIDYEGQAAVELETAAGQSSESQECYPYGLNEEDGVKVVRLSALLSAVVEDLRRSTPASIIALKFHNTIVRMTREVCHLLSESIGIRNVALSGGVFQNRLLLPGVASALEHDGFTVFTHRQVPCGDGGISLGQAAVAGHEKSKLKDKSAK